MNGRDLARLLERAAPDSQVFVTVIVDGRMRRCVVVGIQAGAYHSPRDPLHTPFGAELVYEQPEVQP